MIHLSFGLVAVEPYKKTKKLDIVVKGGLATVSQKGKLLKMLVKQDYSDGKHNFEKGGFVFVKESDFLQNLISTICYDFEGDEDESGCILIPIDRIVGWGK